MSSDDERFGGEIVGVLPSLDHLLFPKQVDWIRALIGYVESRADLFLIIRVHPREFPNKRERVLSDHAVMMQEAFAHLPEQRQGELADGRACRSMTSRASPMCLRAPGRARARRCAWLGMPVVLYAEDLALYPTDLNYVGTTRERVFQPRRAGASGRVECRPDPAGLSVVCGRAVLLHDGYLRKLP